MSHLGRGVALLGFRNTEIIPSNHCKRYAKKTSFIYRRIRSMLVMVYCFTWLS